ncbi:MAG: hypothetical protein IJT94_13365 [Oscillibacter sp.]|nr:hypothetical protein [Oscillibacter sp.]
MSGPDWEAIAASPAVNWEDMPDIPAGFAGAVEGDITSVFLNPAEFGELRTIQYDGNTYENIPVVLNGNIQQNRFHARKDPTGQPTQDHMQGIYLASCILHCKLSDLGGNRPEKGAKLRISDQNGFFRDYYVASSNIEMGMLRVELEALEE